MSTIRAQAAVQWPAVVWLDLAELAALLDVGLDAGGGDPGEGSLHSACCKIEAAKNRRERAVRRAAGRSLTVPGAS
jgi:hypothetical protein